MNESRSTPAAQPRHGHAVGVRARNPGGAAFCSRWGCAFGRLAAAGMDRKQTGGRALATEVDF